MKRRQFLARSASLFALTAQPGKVFAQSFAASLPAQITDLGATELSLAIRMKLLSCEEVMAAYLKP